VGDNVGDNVGVLVGAKVGAKVGVFVGAKVGDKVGGNVGGGKGWLPEQTPVGVEPILSIPTSRATAEETLTVSTFVPAVKLNETPHERVIQMGLEGVGGFPLRFIEYGVVPVESA
jgi:hypothetical protein